MNNNFEQQGKLGPKSIDELEAENAFLRGRMKVSEFITAITGRKEIPMKFEYLGPGAEKYAKVSSASIYSSYIGDSESLDEASKHIANITKHERINLIYAGCGYGAKGIPFLKTLGPSGKLASYTLLDISPQMLLLANATTRRGYQKPLITRCFEWDFEEGNFAHVTDYLKKNSAGTNVILFLGSTIGNLSNRVRILANFRESMSLTDYLVISFTLLPHDTRKLVEAYANNPLADDWMTTALDEVGIKREDGSIKTAFRPESKQIEIRFVFNKDTQGMVEDREIRFHKGQHVLLGISYKFTRSEIRSLLTVAGFKINWLRIGKNGVMATAICQPRQL